MSEDGKLQETLTSSGISFKLSKPTGGSKLDPSLIVKEKESEKNDKDYLVSVEGKELQSVVPKPVAREYIIPLIKTNKWRTPTTSNNKTNHTTDNMEDNTRVDLDSQAAAAILEDLAAGKFQSDHVNEEGGDKGPVIPLLMQNKPPVKIEEDKLNDLPFRPDESTLDDYDDMPISQFGSAMLKGMGWKPGQAIGLNKKGLLEPIEYIPHPGGLGLGATPRPPDPKKSKKIRKPGEVEQKRPMPYKDKDGRVKHVKKIGEEIPEQRPEGFYPGNFAQVCEGPHNNLYGKIIAVDEDSARVVLKLAINDENMTFSQYHLELVSEEDYKRHGRITPGQHQITTKKGYGLILSKKSSSPSLQAHSPPPSSHNSDHHRKRRSEGREIDKPEKRVKSSNKDDRHKISAKTINQAKLDDTKDMSCRHSTTDHYSHRRDKEAMSKKSKQDSKSIHKIDYWIVPSIRVRIVDQNFKKGRYYNMKVTIVDVVDLETCICQTEEGKLLEGVQQRMLETVIPKAPNATVMIVGGKRKGQLAIIVERNSKECQALVKLIQNDELLTIDYDHMCEFTGDIDSLS